MTFKEFIEEHYDIEKLLPWNIKTLEQIVLESDDLPCDDIKYVDGKLTKIVYINDEEFVSVEEILSYNSKEVEKMKACDFKKVYTTYMEGVEETILENDKIQMICTQIQERKQKERMLKSLGD